MAEKLPEDICALLEKSFDTKIENLEVNIHEGNKKGEGFLGELQFFSIKDKQTKKCHHLVVKQVPPREQESTRNFVSTFYVIESKFYTEILPKLQNFQKSCTTKFNFDIVPKCYATDMEKGKEKIMLENLKFKNYEIHPKNVPLPKKLIEKIFQTYGKYHAVSFAFKELRPEEFLELTSSIDNNWLKMTYTPVWPKSILYRSKQVMAILKLYNEVEMLEKFQKYIDNGNEIFKNCIQYKDSYGVVLHGDSWSNNLMFKYNDLREIEDIKLIDFQIVFLGSPVFDLSYNLYAGGSKEDLDNLNKLLEIYHASLRETLQHFDLEVEKIYPFEVLKKEWRKYCAFGFMMGYMHWATRNMEEHEVGDVSQIVDKEINLEEFYLKIKDKKINIVICNLVRHMFENDFL